MPLDSGVLERRNAAALSLVEGQNVTALSFDFPKCFDPLASNRQRDAFVIATQTKVTPPAVYDCPPDPTLGARLAAHVWQVDEQIQTQSVCIPPRALFRPNANVIEPLARMLPLAFASLVQVTVQSSPLKCYPTFYPTYYS